MPRFEVRGAACQLGWGCAGGCECRLSCAWTRAWCVGQGLLVLCWLIAVDTSIRVSCSCSWVSW